MTQYKANVGSSSMTGTPGWNTNRTLGSLSITDGLNSADTQSCTYAYDALARLTSAGCGSVWSQSFTYDAFGNIKKSGSQSFQPTYSATTNQMTNTGAVTPTYDNNGNLTYDGFYNYTWDAEGNLATLNGNAETYDALNRRVEQYNGSAYTEIVYGPTGNKLALMNGQTVTKVLAPLSAGATAVYTSSGLSYYRHPDWLGSSRIASTPSRTLYYDGAYAPFGENYAETGTTDRNFTGQNQDLTPGSTGLLYDFLYREQHSTQGRWISPDPAGIAAADPTNPQSWNAYAYVGNSPCNGFDPLGLDTCTFNIQINNTAGLTDVQLAALEGRVNAVFGSAQSNGNSVQAQFSFTGNPDFTLNISPSTNGRADGYSGWPFSSPTIYWGNIQSQPSATIYGGTVAAHEIVHRGAGPVFDLGGAYNGPPNLMNVNQAQGAGLSQQVFADWSNPAAAAGFASLSTKQVQKLYGKCTNKHPTGSGAGGGGGAVQLAFGGGEGGAGWGPGGLPDQGGYLYIVCTTFLGQTTCSLHVAN